MDRPLQPGAHSPGAATLVAVLLTGLGLAAGAAAWQFHQSRARDLLSRAAADLETVAELKARAVEREAENHLRDATVLARNPYLLQTVSEFLHSGQRGPEVREWLAATRDTGRYELATLTDRAGLIRLTTAPIAGVALSPHLQSIWSEAMRNGQPFLSAPHRYEPGAPAHSDIVVPLRRRDEALGAVILRLSFGDDGGWLSFLPENVGPHQTALLWREGDSTIFVGPPSLAVRAAIPASARTVETIAAQAAAGEIRGRDSDGVPVVAAAAPVGRMGLVLIVKASESAILKPLAAQMRSVALSIGLGAACLLLAVVAVWRRRREVELRALYRRQAKEQELLVASERHFRELVQSIPGGVWLCDAQGKLCYISPQIEQLLALPLSLALREGWTSVIHPHDREACKRAFTAAVAERSSFEVVFRAARADAVEITLLGRALPRFSSTGEFLGLVGNVIDITDRQRAEQRVRQLSAAVEQSPAVVFMTDPEGCIEYVNPRFTEVTGYTPEEAIGRTPAILKSGATPPETYRALWETLRAGREWRGEMINRKKSGELLPVSCIISGIRDSSGALTHFVAAQEDVTGLKRVESELRKSADQIRRIVDANLIGTMVMEGDTIVEANGEFLRAIGYSAEDLRSGAITWRTLTPPEHLPLSEHAHKELLRNGIVHPFQKEYFRKDGTRFPVLLGGTTLYANPRREVCFVLDLSEVRQSEQEIERMNAELRRLSGELLRSEDAERRRLARELHDSTAQLLTGMQFNLKRLEAAIAAESPLRPVFDQTSGMARQCTSEIRAISYAMHPPLLDDLGLTPAIDMLARGFEERTGIRVVIEIAADLGRLDRDLELALFRIVQEALTNVQRHSGSERAAVRLRRGAGGLLLEIEDHGGAVAADRARRARAGVGLLGMRERAKQFGGEMALVSTPTGATVRVRMPLPA